MLALNGSRQHHHHQLLRRIVKDRIHNPTPQ